jgi:hypothetical protein
MKFLLLIYFPLISVTGFSQKRSCIESFKTFRDAVYNNDTATIKSYFSFPFENFANEIWYLVLTEKELEAKNLGMGEITPFTEKDFNRYYKKLFPKQFVKALLKVKSADLFNNGKVESPEIKDGNTSITIYASLDKEESTLTLNVAYNTAWQEKSGEIMDGGESNVIYNFRMLNNGQLLFLNVRLAG